MAERRRRPRTRRRERKQVPHANAFVQSTFNNTLVTVTEPDGAVVAWSSRGSVGFKGSRKSTPYAASEAAEDVGKKDMEHGVRAVAVYVKGPGSGGEAAIRSLQAVG